MNSATDTPLAVPAQDPLNLSYTIFVDYFGAQKSTQSTTWLQLVENLREPPVFRAKAEMPLLKMATFGNDGTSKGSLRHDANLLIVTGVEGDYDGGQVTAEEAKKRLEAHGVRALVYTTPSFNPSAPRWRVLAPLSSPHQPARRESLARNLDTVLGNILARESFVLSQSFYFGRIEGREYRCLVTFDDPEAGAYLDQLQLQPAVSTFTPWGRVSPMAQKLAQEPLYRSADDLVQQLGRPLISGDGRRELIKSYIASKSATRMKPFEIRSLVDGFAKQYFDPNDPVDDSDVDALIRWATQRDAFGKLRSSGANNAEQEPGCERERTILCATSASSDSVASLTPYELQIESHGDIRNARAFASIAQGRFIWVATRDQWLHWNGNRWLPCEKNEHIAEAKRVCGEILNAAGHVLCQDQERGKKLVTDAVASHSLPRIMAMLKLAASEPEMSVVERELDSAPHLLGVENGVVDLRTGNHLPNRPDMLVTRHCDAAYDADAKCHRWFQFLDQIFESDIETIESVQRLLGCTLLGLAGEEILVICYGFGSNGKSVLGNVVYTIAGGYAVTAPPSLLTARQTNDNSPRNDIAALAGSRYLSVNEVQAGDQLDEQVVKMLAGREPITARFLHREFFTFPPTFTPWLRTNHKPVIRGQDDGIWRRLVLLRFGRTFSDAEKDPHLEQKLLAERDGILLWMIEGAQKYLKDGLQLSPRMRAEWAAYRNESDLLGEFLADKTVPNSAGEIDQATLYRNYRYWCEEEAGLHPMSKKSFTQRLAERGHPERKSGPKRYYRGLTLLSVESSHAGGEVDGMDRINRFISNSPHENSIKQKSPKSSTSCPTCPTSAALEGYGDVLRTFT